MRLCVVLEEYNQCMYGPFDRSTMDPYDYIDQLKASALPVVKEAGWTVRDLTQTDTTVEVA